MSENYTVADDERHFGVSVMEDVQWHPGLEVGVATNSVDSAGADAFEIRTPLTELLKAELALEEEGSDESDEEIERFLRVAVLLIRAAVGDGSRARSMLQIGRVIALWAKDAGMAPYAGRSLQEMAGLTRVICPKCGAEIDAAETRAAFSVVQQKFVQAPKEAVGCRTITKGQKPKELKGKYAAGAKGNRNRSRSVAKKRLKAALKED